jgi:transcription antitermination factor NusG
MQQTDALNQGLEPGLNQGLEQSLDQDLNLGQPLGRTEDSAAEDSAEPAEKVTEELAVEVPTAMGESEAAEKVTEELAVEDPTAMGENEAAEKVRVVSESVDEVAAGVSTSSTTATEALAADEGDQMTVGKCEPAAKVSAVEGESEPAEELAEEPAEELAEAPAEKPAEKPDEEPQKSWFVMRDLKRANAKMPAYKLFMEKKIEVFTPMHTVLKVVKGRQQKVQEPFVRDLLFVHDTRATIDPIVEVTPTLQYRYERGKGYKVPMVVRDAEMNRFILAVTASKSTKYYTPGELSPKMIGRNVRITGGPLEGYAGKLLKISGSRTKRLLVQLEGILSAGVEVDAQYIELL